MANTRSGDATAMAAVFRLRKDQPVVHMLAKTVRAVLIFVLVSAATLSATDVRIKFIERKTSSGFGNGNPPPAETTVYVHNKAQRIEYTGYPVSFIGPRTGPEPHTAFIIRCDKHVVYELDFNRMEYRKYPLDRFPSQDRLARAMAKDRKANQGIRQVNTVDTGETRDFYGRIAKHLVTTIKGTGEAPYEEVVDGWYLDIPDPGCSPEYMRQLHVHVETKEDPNSIWVVPVRAGFWYNWLLPAGLAIQVTSRSPVGLGTDVTSTSVQPIERKIVEFSEEPVGSSLFEVPAGFKKVRKFSQ